MIEAFLLVIVVFGYLAVESDILRTPVHIAFVLFFGVMLTPAVKMLLRQSPPFIPTPTKTVDDMLALAQIAPGKRAYDLGCGDGRIVIAAASKGAEAIGYEFSLPTYALAKLRTWRHPRATIRYGNFWKKDISDADVVFCYLLVHTMRDFHTLIWPQLKPGCRVVSHAFRMPGVEPEKLRGDAVLYVK